MSIALAYTVLAIAGATFLVYTAFMVVASARRAIGAGVWMPRGVRLVAYCWLVVGVAADVTFNLAVGTLAFRELPHEFLFTSRVKRHVRESSGWRQEKARSWMEFLNAVDPGHIREIDAA